MKHSCIAVALLLSLSIFSGCKEGTCPVSCGSGMLYYAAVGFTKEELDSAISIAHFPSDNTDSVIISAAHWSYLHGDTTGDTLLLPAGQLNGGFNMSIGLYLTSINQLYDITGITLYGTTQEQLPCREGGTPGGNPVGKGCSGPPFLHAYSENGVEVIVQETTDPGDTAGYIYIHK